MRKEALLVGLVMSLTFQSRADMNMGMGNSMAKPKAPLEKALDSKHKGPNPPADSASMPPGGMMGEDMMAHMGKMGQMMMGMSKMGPSQATGTELPGFPGQSHLYHVGATGFFLDHASMLNLTPEQKVGLEKIKEKNASDDKTLAKDVKRLEEELWALTGSDRPDIKNIEAKTGEIEAARKNRRIAFIRAVGEAANLLTVAQRDAVLGKKSSSSPTNQAEPPSKGMSNPSSGMGGMGDM